MRNRILTLLALVLCMSALFLPVTAYAATADDTQPPSVNAWLDGETLHAEASDRHSGVEAVYVNGHRFGYLVDGAVEASPLRDYAGTDEYISVHAVDYAGNKSKVVELKNPYYTAPATQPEQIQTTPAPDPTPQPSTPAQSSSGGGSSQPSTTSRPATTPPASSSTPEVTSTPAVTSEPVETESAVPDGSGSNAFTPDGTGSVQDNATEQDGKEFFTIVTENENTFFLVIDRQRDSEGVYLLNAVTEDDLMALAESSGSSTGGESAIPTPAPEPTPTPEPATPEPEPQPEPAAENNTGMIIFVVIAVLAAGGAGYYFKILKPKQQAAIDGDDEDDLDDYDDEPDAGDDYEFSDDEDYDAEFLDDDLDSKEDGDTE